MLALAGILLVAGFERGHLRGLAVALLGALLAAVFPVLNRRLVLGQLDPLVMVGWEMIGAHVVSAACDAVVGGGRLPGGLRVARLGLAVAVGARLGVHGVRALLGTSACSSTSAPTPATSR